MNSFDLMLSDEEREFVRERYPGADLDDLSMPVAGLSDVTSLEYLDYSLRSDIENNGFKESGDPQETLEMARMILKKIQPFMGWERKGKRKNVVQETTTKA